jgi:hypothetical protein
MTEPVFVALQVVALGMLVATCFVACMAAFTLMSPPPRPTPEQWDLAMANALDMAGSLELEIAPDAREMMISCLRTQMRAEPSAEVRAAFVTAALIGVDRRRVGFGLRPLEYALTGYDSVAPGARVYRGHPDGGTAETLYEQQLREERGEWERDDE